MTLQFRRRGARIGLLGLLAVVCLILGVVSVAAAGHTATSPCVNKTCLYDVTVDVSLKNGIGYGLPSRLEGTISARIRATFRRVPIRELRFPGSSRYALIVQRGLKNFNADTSAPGTLRATVNATIPCRINRSYNVPALLTVGGAFNTGGAFEVIFGPTKAPASSGCRGTAFGLQKIVVGGGGLSKNGITTNVALGEFVNGAPGKNDLDVLAGSYQQDLRRAPRAAESPMPKLRAGRSFKVAHSFTNETSPGSPLVFRMTFTRVG